MVAKPGLKLYNEPLAGPRLITFPCCSTATQATFYPKSERFIRKKRDFYPLSYFFYLFILLKKLPSKMLSSLNPLQCLDKLTVNSLDSIGERVRLALLHVFLPRLCENCRPGFSATFRVTQSTPALLKCLCDTCKISYVRDKRAATRKKSNSNAKKENQPEEEISSNDESVSSTKIGAKKKIRSQATEPGLEASGNVTIQLPKPTKKAKLSEPENNPFNEQLPISPPPEDEIGPAKPVKQSTNPPLTSENPIYHQLTAAGVDWCRYCGVAGDTGTFWKLGPWGDRTLCHKHGCEFFGSGFARATSSRLDLTAFYQETRASRTQPIIKDFCAGCWQSLHDDNSEECAHKTCHGCPLAFHAGCLKGEGHVDACGNWYCTAACESNFAACLIRPQFPSKARFPYYLSLPQIDLEALQSQTPTVTIPRITLRLVLPPPVVQPKKHRKYRKHNSDDTSADRVIAFVPIKVDHSVHEHEDISTPQWAIKSLEERLAYESVFEAEFEPEELDDTVLLERHARYEHVEKTTRLLKPGVLEKLANGESVA